MPDIYPGNAGQGEPAPLSGETPPINRHGAKPGAIKRLLECVFCGRMQAGDKAMTIQSLKAAGYLCHLSGDSITPLKIQKVLYAAHMFCLGQSEGAHGITDEAFEAWDYGPVLPSVYHKAKRFGNTPIIGVFDPYGHPEDNRIRQCIENAYNLTKKKTASEMVQFTHWEHGAWNDVYQPGRNNDIPNISIFDEFHTRRDKAEKAMA